MEYSVPDNTEFRISLHHCGLQYTTRFTSPFSCLEIAEGS